MPSIFDNHHLQAAAKRIAADGTIDLNDARAVRDHLNKVIANAEKATSSEARRNARLQAALTDEAKAPAVAYARGALSRLGLDFTSASDIHKLNAALVERKIGTVERIELKKVLSVLGVID